MQYDFQAEWFKWNENAGVMMFTDLPAEKQDFLRSTKIQDTIIIQGQVNRFHFIRRSSPVLGFYFVAPGTEYINAEGKTVPFNVTILI